MHMGSAMMGAIKIQSADGGSGLWRNMVSLSDHLWPLDGIPTPITQPFNATAVGDLLAHMAIQQETETKAKKDTLGVGQIQLVGQHEIL